MSLTSRCIPANESTTPETLNAFHSARSWNFVDASLVLARVLRPEVGEPQAARLAVADVALEGDLAQ